MSLTFIQSSRVLHPDRGPCSYTQCELMSVHYKQPILLIEFEEHKSFSLEVCYYQLHRDCLLIASRLSVI